MVQAGLRSIAFAWELHIKMRIIANVLIDYGIIVGNEK